MASLPRPAPSLTPPAGDCLVRASQKSAPNGTLVRLTSSPRAFNVSGALPATLMLIAETTSRGEHLLPTMPTWLRLAQVRPVGLEPTRPKALEPKSSASASSATDTLTYSIFARPTPKGQPVRPVGLEPTRPIIGAPDPQSGASTDIPPQALKPASPGGRLAATRTQ